MPLTLQIKSWRVRVWHSFEPCQEIFFFCFSPCTPVWKELLKLDTALVLWILEALSVWAAAVIEHLFLSPSLTRHGNPLSLVLSPKVSFRHQSQKTYSARGFIWDNLISCLKPKIIWILYEPDNLALGNPRHQMGKLKGFADLLFGAFIRAYVDVYMKLLYPSCFVRSSLAILSSLNGHSLRPVLQDTGGIHKGSRTVKAPTVLPSRE